MRILQVCAVDFTAFHMLGGLLRGTRALGWGAEVVCADGEWAARLRAEGIRHRAVHMTRSASPVALARATFELARSLRADPPDLIHTHTPAGGLVGRAAAAAAFSGPVVHTFHGLPFEGEPRGVKERAFLIAERLVARRTTRFFSQARGDVARADRLGIGDPARTLVIGNGVDIRRFAPDASARARVRDALGIPTGAIVITVVSRLVREKGLLELAGAAMLLAGDERVHFLVVGGTLPSDRTGIAAELDAHPVVDRLGPRWHRLGFRDDVAAILVASDVFTLPSYREGLPRSIIEAMATALPVVATDIPACAELVRHGETGALVPVADATALAGTLASFAADAALRERLGRRAREIALAEHDEARIVRTQLEAFRKMLRP